MHPFWTTTTTSLFFWVVFVVCFTTLSSARFWFSLARRKERSRCFVQRHFKHDGTTGSPQNGPSLGVGLVAGEADFDFCEQKKRRRRFDERRPLFRRGERRRKRGGGGFRRRRSNHGGRLVAAQRRSGIADAAERDAVARLTIIGRGKFRHPKRRRRRREEDHRDKDKEGKRKRASLSLEERLRDVPEEKTIVIGRNNTNTYVLDVPDLPYLLSRTHAKCVSAGDEHFIYDFKTTNGTYINGKIIEKQKFVKLMHGDIVSFGGPANVLRNEKSMKNPFRFRYLRTKVARDFETGSRAFQQQTQRELLRQNTNNNASEVSGAAVRKRDHGVAGNANAAAARAGGNVGPSGAKKLKMSTFPLVGKGVDAQPLTLGGGYDDEFVPIFSQGPSQEIDDYGTIVHSQNIDGSVDHEKIRETFEEGLLKLFEARGGEFAQKFNSAFMNIPIEKEKNKVVAKDVDKGAVVVDDDAGTSGEKKVGDDAKMESADESPEDDSQTKNKKKKSAKTAVTANDDDDFTHQVGSDNISDGSNEEHEMETADHKKRNDLDVQLMAKLSRSACANPHCAIRGCAARNAAVD